MAIYFKMIKCRWSFLFFITFTSVLSEIVKNDFLKRAKRTLVYPTGSSKLLAICGYGIPVDLKPETVIVGMVFKANYDFPTNASEITHPYATYERKKRGLDRWDLYKTILQAIEMRGLSGKSCLLKMICEMARTPLDKNFGLFHELFHKILTPTTTKEKISHHSDNEYYAAHYYGRRKMNCKKIFKDCPSSILDVFTFVKDA